MVKNLWCNWVLVYQLFQKIINSGEILNKPRRDITCIDGTNLDESHRNVDIRQATINLLLFEESKTQRGVGKKFM